MNRYADIDSAESRPIKRIKLATGYAGLKLHAPEEITTVSLDAFEARVKQVAEVSELSQSQLKYVSHCRHLIRNRDYARLSRARRRQEQEEMRTRIEELEHQVLSLQQQCFSLLKSNMELHLQQEQQQQQHDSAMSPTNAYLSEIEWF